MPLCVFCHLPLDGENVETEDPETAGIAHAVCPSEFHDSSWRDETFDRLIWEVWEDDEYAGGIENAA